MTDKEITVILLIVSFIVVGYLCKDTWDRPNWIAGRGTVKTLIVSSVILGLLLLKEYIS